MGGEVKSPVRRLGYRDRSLQRSRSASNVPLSVEHGLIAKGASRDLHGLDFIPGSWILLPALQKPPINSSQIGPEPAPHQTQRPGPPPRRSLFVQTLL